MNSMMSGVSFAELVRTITVAEWLRGDLYCMAPSEERDHHIENAERTIEFYEAEVMRRDQLAALICAASRDGRSVV